MIPMAEHVVTMDSFDHTKTQVCSSKLITPKRSSENEEFMWRLADPELQNVRRQGLSASPWPTTRSPSGDLVIADLLGVPVEDHAEFRAVMTTRLVDINASDTVAHDPLVWPDEKSR